MKQGSLTEFSRVKSVFGRGLRLLQAAALLAMMPLAAPAPAVAAVTPTPVALGDAYLVNSFTTVNAPDPQGDSGFGWAVAVDGDTAVIGAGFNDVSGQADAGSAYVYVRSGGVWRMQQKLAASDPAYGGQFGKTLAIDGDTIVVGAVGLSSYAGAAYVFTRTGTTWTQQQKITPADLAAGDQFGGTVDISGNTIAIGSRLDDNASGVDAGAVYVYTRSGATWSEQQKFVGADVTASEMFGHSVGISGDTIVTGCVYDGYLGEKTGSAYVFTRSGTTWSQQQKVTASDAEVFDHFGHSVAIDGESIVVGAVYEGGQDGAAYVFTRSATAWTQQQKLTSGDVYQGRMFGFSVGISGDRVCAGAPYDSIANTNAGSAYLFTRSGATWTRNYVSRMAGPAAGELYGYGSAVSGDSWVIGALGDQSPVLGGSASFSVAYPEDNAIVVAAPGPLANDTSGGSKSAVMGAGPAHGGVVLNADGSFTYTPTANWFGTDSFTYYCSDGTTQSALATVTLVVGPVNDAPQFTKGANVSSAEDTAYSAAWASAIGPGPNESETTSFTITNSSNAMFAVQPTVSAAGVLSYTPAPNMCGSVNATATLTDAYGASTSATFTINVTGVNDAPSFAKGGDVSSPEDTVYSAAWASAISAGPNETQGLSFALQNSRPSLFTSQPAVAANGTLSFRPAADANGSAEVTVTLTDDATIDGVTRSAVATFTLTVTPVNDAPVASADTTGVAEDTTLTAFAPGLLLNDYDVDNDPLTATSLVGPSHGTVVLNENGSYTYRPNDDYNGADAFYYQAYDGSLSSLSTMVEITVAPVNDPPTFTGAGDVTVAEDSGAYSAAWASAMSAGPANESGQSLSWTVENSDASLFATPPAMGADGTLSFRPADNANGSSEVTVTLTDDATAGGAALSKTATFTITVTPVPDVTQFTLTSGSTTLTAFGDSYRFSGVLTSNGEPAAECTVALQSAVGTSTAFADAGATASTDASGAFSFSVTPGALTRYRAVFAGLEPVYLASESAAVRVMPRAWVSDAVMAASVYVSRSTRITGTMKPRHAMGTKPVRIKLQRWSGDRWVSYGSIAAEVTSVASDSCGYSASVTFPKSGTWRVRPYAPTDAAHAYVYSAGYTKFTVQSRGNLAVAIAKSVLGKPYQWGAYGPDAFDSSGLTRWVFRRLGVDLPHKTSLQKACGRPVAKSALRPGDLVFTRNSSCVGIYIGSGKIIHADKSGGVVSIRLMHADFDTARRVW